MKEVDYLNLTNGLEFIYCVKDYKVVRIQSTMCEAKNYDKLIKDLDYNFLLDLAQGYTVNIYDMSQHKKMSRALYQGVEFIRYALEKRWFDREIVAKVNGFIVTDYFRQEYDKLSGEAKAKLDYTKKFLNTDKISINKISGRTTHDGDYEYYRKILAKWG